MRDEMLEVVVEGATDRFFGRPLEQNPYERENAAEAWRVWALGWTEADRCLDVRGAEETALWLRRESAVLAQGRGALMKQFNPTAERAVLHDLMAAASLGVGTSYRALDRCYAAAGLLPDHFYLEPLGRLYGHLVRMRLHGESLDWASVVDELERAEASQHDAERLAQRVHDIMSFSYAPFWALRVVKDTRLRREGDLAAEMNLAPPDREAAA